MLNIVLKNYDLENCLNFKKWPYINEVYFSDASLIMFFFIFVILILFVIIFFLYFLSKQFTTNNSDVDKISPYECGFDIFQSIHTQFEIQFYIICLLYIAFDIEILIILPFILNLYQLNFVQFYSGLTFFFFLIIGYIYEYYKKVFDF